MKRALLVLTILAACSHATPTRGGASGAAPAGGGVPAAGVPPAELSPEQLRVVQRSLVDRGFAVDPTGTFDDRTRSALTDFQRARGLPATAALDRPTLDALGLDPGDVLPAGREGLGAQPHEERDRAPPGVGPLLPGDPGHPAPREDDGRGDGSDR